jgi:hypothetical protein
MKNIYKIGILVTIAFGINFCASVDTRKAFDAWIGKDINSLISWPSWGPPSDVYTMPNGNKMYSWLRIGGTVMTTNFNYYFGQATSNVYQKWCKYTFTTNTSDIIISWRAEGNDCL